MNSYYSISLMKHAIELQVIFLIFLSFSHLAVAVFHETVTNFTVLEGTSIGTTIGRLQLSSDRTYRISGKTQPFGVDLKSGRVYISEEVDREQADIINGTVTFLIISTSPPSIHHVFLHILDINDNSPYFPLPFQNLSIVEMSPIGSRIPILPASDPDEGLNGTIVSYSLSPEGTFGLVYQPTDSEGDLLYLELLTTLDREQASSYRFNLTATDAGTPSRSATTTIYVEVLDVNDNAPIFHEKEIKINWNGQSDGVIALVEATDADSGANGRITYTIPSPIESEYFEILNGNELHAKINHPSICTTTPNGIDECLVTVRAIDGGSPPLSSSLLVHITITSDNLHDPQIHIRLQPSNVDFAVIDSYGDIGRTVAVLTVTDEDGPLTDKSTLEIIGGNEENVFSLLVQKQFSILRLHRKPDDTLPTLFELIFRASDGQVPSRSSQRALRIYRQTTSGAQMSDDGSLWSIRDIQLRSTPSDQVHVAEDAPIGSFVSLISANITGCQFQIVTSDIPFVIDSENGVITTSSLLYTTSKWKYEVELSVLPPPPAIRPLSTFITISVDDVNDHAPVFNNIPAIIKIPEDTEVGTEIWKFQVFDEDKSDNAQWTVDIIPSESSDYFRLSPTSSNTFDRLKRNEELKSTAKDVRLILQKPVDFEKINQMSIEIRATDSGRLTSTATIHIHILDINDNRPEFTCHHVYTTIPSNAEIGADVIRLEATDLDKVSAKSIRYILTSGSMSVFNIDSISGEIRKISDTTESLYTLQVTALDEGLLASSENCTVYIRITKSDDHIPYLDVNSEINLKGNIAVGQTIGHLKTNVTKITSTTDVISVSSDGRLILKKRIIKPIGASILAHQDDIIISKCLKITPEEASSAPYFVKRSSIIELPNPVIIGQPLLQVMACSSNDCVYTTTCMMLNIEKDGLIRFKSDISLADHIKCNIQANDSLGRSDIMEIDVKRSTSDESKILNLRRAYHFSIYENSTLGTIFGALPNSTSYIYRPKLEHSVSITDIPIGLFPDGVLYVRRRLNHHLQQHFRLTIEAINRKTNSTYITNVIINIIDVNDHSPSCQMNTFQIQENMPIGTVIGNLIAEDLDYGRNAILRFELLTHKDLIYISPSTGQLRSLTIFDYEKIQNLTLIINIFDNGLLSRNKTCNIFLNIVDMNDNKPMFDYTHYSVFSKLEDKFLVKVHAEDLDAGQNGQVYYELDNHQNHFSINESTGDIYIISKLYPSSLYNISIKARDNGLSQLFTNSFVLVRTENDINQLPIFIDKPFMNALTIEKSKTPIGSVIGVIRIESDEIIHWNSNDSRISIDSWGKMILTENEDLPSQFDIIATASTKYTNSSKTFKFQTKETDSNSDYIIHVKENQIPAELKDFKTSDAKIIFIEPSSQSFSMKDGLLTLVRPLDRELISSYRILIQSEAKYHLLNIKVDDVNDNEPSCLEKTLLITEIPSDVHMHCFDLDSNDDDNELSITTSDKRINVTDRMSFSLTQELQDVVNVVHYTLHDGTQMSSLTLLRGSPDPAIIFPSTHFSLLLSSATKKSESFGRITAESPLPLQYFVIGSSSINIDRFSGELIVAEEEGIRQDKNITIVAASARGTATTQVSIEVIEDALYVTSDAFLMELPRDQKVSKPIGKIDVGRAGVQYMLEDPYLLMQGNSVILQQEIPEQQLPYMVSIEARKGRLSAIIKLMIITSTSAEDTYPSRFWVRENSNYGTIIGSVPQPQEKWQIVENIGLTLDSKNRLVTSRIFDREEQSIYIFHIKNEQSGQIIELELLIEDDNDNKPIIINNNMNISLYEDVLVGEIIGNINFIDLDLNNIFYFDIISGNEFGNFFIFSNGTIRLEKSLDRESISNFNLSIILNDGIAPYSYNSVKTNVFITVLDVNDNSPLLTSSKEFYVFENSPMGHIIGRLTADDLDSEDDGLIQFRILPNSLPMAEFLINGITGDIIVNKQIDYEQSSFIEFIVELSDSGSPCLKSQEKIIIHVIDINDNIPVIINNIKTFKLSESALIGQIIHQFQISDLDGTEDNRLSLFSLANDYSSTFDILPLSGQLIVASDSLDFELTKSYNLTIQATNIAGGDVVEVWIEIELKDENDEAPRFINGCPVHFEMFENTAPAIVGATVADDEDDGDNGLIAYSIVEGNMTLFSVNSASGIITSLVPMDREESSKHSLKIQVTDSGRPRLSAICDVIITILDDNDNIPIFNQPYYQVETDENASNGTLLTTIFAEDADFEDNGRITYRILSPETVPFIIDPNNGNIYTMGLIDREITSYYDLIIEASDHGRYHRKTNIIHVYIHVNDLNDNSPIIRNSQLDVFIPSTLKTGEVVHVIDAYDPDLNDKLTFTLSGPDASSFSINDNGELILQKIWISSKSYYSITVTVNDNNDQNTSASFTYYIQDIDMFPRFITSTPKIVIREHQSSTVFRFEAKPTQTSSGSVLYSILGGNGDDVFEINTVSGQLKSRITLDRERKSSYRLWIQATNTEIPPKSSWQSIDIIVDDVNDNAPIFKKVVYDVDIEENTLTKDALLSVQATDSDSGNNGNITYSIINGNRAGIFSIDESSGAIYCHEQLDRESRAMHTLTIMASDQGTPSLNATALVQIHVLDVDDNSPRFTRIFYREISEDTEVGTEVLQIIATDVDATENYTFILDNYNDIFKINTKTGMITTLKTLDRETKSAYRLMIRVDDGSWTIQTNAMITISDMNDNAPIFAKDEYFFLINDNSLKNLTNGGYIIGYINASDRDIGDNGRIRYHLYSDNSYVTIHPSTGELRLIRYPSDLIQIMVVATDNGNPEQSTNCSVVILWQPIASARPQQSVLAFKSSLNQTVIGKLDDVYKIIALYPKNIIQIDNNYSIYILSNMNITISNQTLIHILTISIYNELIYQPLELLISDTIFKPIFKENRTHITVSESAPIGSEIISLDASNGNPLLKQTLQYSILNSNNKAFRITSSGVILVASSTEIDYERNKNHHLKIEASAGGYNSLLDVHIDILDDNDNSPEFVTKLKPFISFSQKDSLCLNAYDADSEPLSHTEFVTNSEDVLLDSETGCMSVVSSSNISERFYVIVSALNGEYHHTNCLIDIIYIPSIYTNQFIKSTKEEIVRKDVCSAAPNGTIILKSTIQSSFAVLPSSEVHLNIDHRVIFWSGRHHEPFAPSERMNVWELTQYGRFAKHFQLDIHLNPLVAPAPVFDKDYYEMDVATPVKNGFIIHNFHWILPADCHVELSSDTSFSPPICLSSDGLLTVCGQVTLPFYQVTLKIFQGNSIVSLTNTIIRFKSTSWKSVLLNTNFRVAYIRENSNPQQILRIHNNNELKNIRFNITNTNMAKIFSISNDGILYTQHKLDRERRAVYRIPIEISYQPSFTEMIEVGVIVDDEVDSTDSLDSYDVRIFAASNHEIYADVHPSTIDISKQYRCLSINQPKHSVNSSCYLHLTSNSDNNSSLSLMASDGQMPYKYTVYWNHIETPDEYSSNLLNNSIALTLFGPDDGVADLLTTLRRNLPDFTVIPLIVSKANSLNRTIVFAVKDRNQNLLMSKDSLPIFQRFSEKNILSSIDIQSVWPVSLLCQNTPSPCSGSLQCQPFTKFNNQSMLLRGQTEIWSIREGSLNIKCECVKSNGCSSSILPKLVVLTDSLDSDVTVAPIATKTMPKVATSCSNYDCGNHGRCIETSENTLMCHCDGGFTATYCDLENSAISLVSSDHIIMKPTISLRQLSDVVIPSQRLTTTGMPSSKDCNDGRQLIEMDFKTTTDDVLPLLTLDYGDVRAVVQLRHSQLVYMVTDGYRNPIEIVLSQIVSDGQFHTFSLQLSPDRKMMTFQVDGVGKEARSMKPMPNLISSSIKNILIGSASKKTIDSIVCVRKLLINRQLQVLQMNQHFASYQYFLPTTVGTVRSCSKTSGTPVKPITHSSTTSSTSSASSSLNPGLLATLIGIGGLTGCAFVTLGIWKVWSILTTDSCPTAPSGGWKPATEFRAFPKHKESQLEVPSNQISSTSICSSLKMTTASSGHFNNAMALSVASLSTSDDGYEVPIQNYVENFNHMISANCNRNSYSKPTYNSYF